MHPNNPACLTELELTRLVEGEAEHRQRDRWLSHVELCPGCRLVLAESSKHLARVDQLARARRTSVVLVAFAALVLAWLFRG